LSEPDYTILTQLALNDLILLYWNKGIATKTHDLGNGRFTLTAQSQDHRSFQDGTDGKRYENGKLLK
jgi:hypothetical protein